MRIKRYLRIVLTTCSTLLLISLVGSVEASESAAEGAEPGKSVAAAVRAQKSPVVDGRLDDLVWAQAKWFDGLLQNRPVYREAPSQKTAFAVAYDDNTIYFAFRCEVSPAFPMVTRLTRRDRSADFDVVSVTLAPRGDGRTGYEFQINPYGVQRDLAWTDDGSGDESWDAVWRAETQILQTEWTAEIAIPLNQIRFPAGLKTWGLQVNRWISSAQENIAFNPVPPERSGWISNVGTLTGVEDIRPSLPLSVTPEAFVSYRSTSDDFGGNGKDGFGYGFGAYAKAGVAPDVVLDLAFNPDFGQVEVDNVVLNLTAYETQFPEKRPFFLESAGLFQTPIELFYSRRLGAPPPEPSLGANETASKGPSATQILSAAKLTGRSSHGLSVGAIDAVFLPTEFTVTNVDTGLAEQRESTPWTNAAVLRVVAEPKRNYKLGLLGTALNPDSSKGSYTAGGDWTLKTPDLMYAFRGQAAGSFRVDNVLQKEKSSGVGVWTQLAREGGKHFRVWATYQFYSDEFDPNDLGFIMRNDLHWYDVHLQFRQEERWGPFAEFYAGVEPTGRFNTDGLDLAQEQYAYINTKWNSNWYSEIGGYRRNEWYDDRETRGGPPLKLPTRYGWWFWTSSPQNKAFGANLNVSTATRPSGFAIASAIYFTLRLDRIELNLGPEYSQLIGDLAYAGSIADDAGEEWSVIGRLDLQNLNLNLNGTFVITRDLTFQIYTQWFTCRADYSEYERLLADSSTAPQAFADEDADFNRTDLRIQAIARWEYLPGSALYAVYTRLGYVAMNERGRDLFETLDRTSDEEHQQMFMLKLSHAFM